MVGAWIPPVNFLNDGPWPGSVSQIFSPQIVFFKVVFVTAKGNKLEHMWTGKYLQLLWLLSNFPVSRFLQIRVVCVLIETLFTNFPLRMACLSCQLLLSPVFNPALCGLNNHGFLAETATALIIASLETIFVGTFWCFSCFIYVVRQVVDFTVTTSQLMEWEQELNEITLQHFNPVSDTVT